MTSLHHCAAVQRERKGSSGLAAGTPDRVAHLEDASRPANSGRVVSDVGGVVERGRVGSVEADEVARPWWPLAAMSASLKSAPSSIAHAYAAAASSQGGELPVGAPVHARC